MISPMPLSDANATEAGGDYLPSVSQRYHQILGPTLQLCAGILLMLDSDHSSAASQASVLPLNEVIVSHISHQAMDFLNVHRDAFVLLLRSSGNGVYLTASIAEDLNFLVSLCTTIMPSIPPTELVCSLLILHILLSTI